MNIGSLKTKPFGVNQALFQIIVVGCNVGACKEWALWLDRLQNSNSNPYVGDGGAILRRLF